MPLPLSPLETGTRGSPRVYSVSELTREIRAILEESFHSVGVTGEISNLHRHSSGHVYFTLKDSQAQIRAVLWRTNAARLRFQLEDGMEVMVQGRLAVYEPRGEYQIVSEIVEPKGLGALQVALEQLRRRLEEERLFDPSRKRSLPFLPQRIAVVTSPTGAALKDILRVVFLRCGNARVLVVPVRVQGEGAAADVAKGIALANDVADVDVLIVGRGGGSFEDLFAFNEEIVVRAIAASRVPVISAVGHEVDVTLSDLVADRRAQTPTEAAEIVVPDRVELERRLFEGGMALVAAMRREIVSRRAGLDAIGRSQALWRPIDRVRALQQLLDDWSGRLASVVRLRFHHAVEAARVLSARIEGLSPLRVLDRGFSLTLHDGVILHDAQGLHPGDRVRTLLARGAFTATVTEVEAASRIDGPSQMEGAQHGEHA